MPAPDALNLDAIGTYWQHRLVSMDPVQPGDGACEVLALIAAFRASQARAATLTAALEAQLSPRGHTAACEQGLGYGGCYEPCAQARAALQAARAEAPERRESP